MITAVAGLETGKVTIQEMINDNGPFYVTDDPNYTKHPKCWYFNSYGRGHGRLNVATWVAFWHNVFQMFDE